MFDKLKIFFVLLLAVAFSCKSPNENEIPPSSPNMSQPIVTGIYITNSTGPEAIGKWGNPTDGYSTIDVAYPIFSINSNSSADSISDLKKVSTVSTVVPIGLKLNNPYPNPFIGTCAINFSIPTQSNVVIYIVPARWFDENSNDVNSSIGAVTAAPKRTAIAILTQRELTAGSYSLQWRSSDQNGNPLSSGFYRIYLRVGDTVCWHDVYLYDARTYLPVNQGR
jgi:hypothetical protein